MKHICLFSNGEQFLYSNLSDVVFPYLKVCEIKKVILQRKVFIANPENLMLAMLVDNKMEIRNLAVNRI